MKDRRGMALGVVLQRRRRLDTRLNAQLSSKRAEKAELLAAEKRQRELYVQGQATLDRQSERLKSMASGGGRVAPGDYQAGMQWRGVLEERCLGLQADCQRAGAAVQRKDAEIARTIADIRANQTRMEAYEKRIEALRREAERNAEEAQDDEALEGRRPRREGHGR